MRVPEEGVPREKIDSEVLCSPSKNIQKIKNE